MNNFEFTPADGLMDKTSFPTNLGSETEARQQFMTLFNQIKDFINTDIVEELTKVKGKVNYTNNSLVVKLDNGLILQAGGIDSVTNQFTDVTFTEPFKNVVFTWANARSGQAGSYANCLNTTKTGMQVATDRLGLGVYWFAVGV